MNKSVLRIVIAAISISVISVGIATELFGFWGAMSLVLMLALVAVVALTIRENISGEQKFSPEAHPTKSQTLADCGRILGLVLLIRIATYLLAYIVARMNYVTDSGFFASMERIWVNSKIDAPSYLGIAENGYVTTGDPMYHIVFFPFFPMVVKAFQLITGNYVAAALVVNLLASFGIGIASYKLVLLDFDRRTALRIVRYIFIIPAAFFYAAAMTESLFVLLCILCIYFARTRKFLLCALFGTLAAFTRPQGVLLILPCAYIAVADFIRNRIKDKTQLKPYITLLVKRLLCVLCISLGLVAYLYINYRIWGTPFKFMQFQKSHWSQQLGFFPSTVGTLYEQLLLFWSQGDNNYTFALWLPELISIFASLIVMLFVANKLHPSYTLFFIAYFTFSVGATWLLSAPRYLMACVSLPFALAVLGNNKKVDITITTLCVLSGGTFLYMYAAGSSIY